MTFDNPYGQQPSPPDGPPNPPQPHGYQPEPPTQQYGYEPEAPAQHYGYQPEQPTQILDFAFEPQPYDTQFLAEPDYGQPRADRHSKPAAPSNGRRIALIAVLAGLGAFVVTGAILLATRGGSGKVSQADLCDQVRQQGNLVAQQSGGTKVTVTAGGSAPADVPAVPAHRSAECTMTVTTQNGTVPVYVGVYSKKVNFTSYRSTLESNGFTADSAGGTTLTDSGKHVVLLLQLADWSAIEILTVPN